MPPELAGSNLVSTLLPEAEEACTETSTGELANEFNTADE
jgi:hypothetical protein